MPNSKLPGPYDGLPEHVRTNPTVMVWVQDQHERRIRDLESKPSLPTLPPALSPLAQLPAKEIIVAVILAVLALAGHISPEQGKTIALKLLGVAG